MHVALEVLILLLALALSGVIARLVPKSAVPLPVVQIALGAALTLPSLHFSVALDPELFFLLFVPPLLFADGWRMPKREFFQLGAPILALALGLVLATVAALGYFLHWLVPTLPLAAAFAFAAVLSPTDAVAVSAITQRTPVPGRLMQLLGGEALMNDASALVAMRFALQAMALGSFAFTDAAASFAGIAVGGLGVGVAITLGFSALRRKLVLWSGEDPASQVALLMLLPFAAYLLAEHLEWSGILAAAAAGMTLSYTDIVRGSRLITRMQMLSMSRMVEFVFNGLIFLLLGQQLPGIVGRANLRQLRQDTHLGLLEPLLYVMLIFAVLMLIRFAWVWLMLVSARLRTRRAATLSWGPGLRLCLATSLAGIRGAVTLAAALSLPLTLADGTPFPERDLLIFLAAGVILLSLGSASLLLPPLFRGLTIEVPQRDASDEERLARCSGAEAAIRAIEDLDHRRTSTASQADVAALYSDVAARVMSDYRQRLEALRGTPERAESARIADAAERELRLAAVRAERDDLYRLRHLDRINDPMLRKLLSEVDLIEAALLREHNE
jgi:CPA1 family monovalent cation:H+ antiporter